MGREGAGMAPAASMQATSPADSRLLRLVFSTELQELLSMVPVCTAGVASTMVLEAGGAAMATGLTRGYAVGQVTTVGG